MANDRGAGIERRRARSTLAVLLAFGPAEEATVGVGNFAFMPDTLTGKTCATVTSVDHDEIPHLVVATDGDYRPMASETNHTFEVGFDKLGDYAYFCGVHPPMRVKIVVGQ